MFSFPSFVIESVFVSFCFYSLSLFPHTYSIPVLSLSLSYMLSGQFSLAVPQDFFSLTLERASLPDWRSGKDSGVPANLSLPTGMYSKVFSFLSLHCSLSVCVLFREGFTTPTALILSCKSDWHQGDFKAFIMLVDIGGKGGVEDVGEKLMRETGPGPAF